MSTDDEKAQKFFAPHKLDDLPRFADAEGKLYQAFGLMRANWKLYFNSQTLLRLAIAMLEGHWPGMPAGDVERMPGVFLLVNGEIRKSYRHKLVSDQPDYLKLAETTA